MKARNDRERFWTQEGERLRKRICQLGVEIEKLGERSDRAEDNLEALAGVAGQMQTALRLVLPVLDEIYDANQRAFLVAVVRSALSDHELYVLRSIPTS